LHTVTALKKGGKENQKTKTKAKKKSKEKSNLLAQVVVQATNSQALAKPS
jgi:hypothetical protein